MATQRYSDMVLGLHNGITEPKPNTDDITLYRRDETLHWLYDIT